MGSSEGINAIPFENHPPTVLLKYLDHSENNLNVSGDFSLYNFHIKCLSNRYGLIARNSACVLLHIYMINNE